MKNIYMIVDSFSGMSKAEANEMGYGYMPQLVKIDEKEYKDGIDIFMKDSIDLIKNAKSFLTSVPPVGEIMDIIEKSAKEYDMVIYWPMNKGITSTYSTVMTVARDYQNVHVIDTKMYDEVLKNVIIKSNKMLQDGSSIEKVHAYVKEINDKTIQYILPKTIDSMIKSGRISGAKKVIMEKGRLIPRLKFTDNGLKAVAVKRSFGKMVKKTIQNIAEEINNSSDYDWLVLHTGDFDSVKIAEDAIKELGFTNKRQWIPPVVSGHIGIGGIGISVFPKIKNPS